MRRFSYQPSTINHPPPSLRAFVRGFIVLRLEEVALPGEDFGEGLFGAIDEAFEDGFRGDEGGVYLQFGGHFIAARSEFFDAVGLRFCGAEARGADE